MACNDVRNSIPLGVKTATATGSSIALEEGVIGVVGYVDVTARTDGTYTIKLQHSADNLLFLDVGTATSALSTTGIAIATAPSPTLLLPYIRAVCTVAAATTGATLKVDLLFQKQ